ncbi:MAG: hypothetical protein ACR2OB_06660 [Solirubrobacteraceae bacterium]
MDPTRANELIERVRSLPAAAPLVRCLGERDVRGPHLVGGAVRDLLMGGEPDDLDLVVEGDPVVLAMALGGEVQVHDRFATATVFAEGFTYDIARARRETYAVPGALPAVSPAGLEEDLQRRDFTVNAIAIALGPPEPGRLTAGGGALEDLGAGRLRVLHDRSFIDDPTRLLRLVRYASRLGFVAEARTHELARAAVRARVIASVSGSRIGAELRLLARERDPIAALFALAELELDSSIHPGFRLDDPALAHRALALLPGDGRRDLLALGLAARGVPGAELASLLDSLAFAGADRDTILATAARGERTAAALAEATLPSEIGTVLQDAGPELVALAGALGPAARAREWLERLRKVSLAIDGDDLIAAGIPEGPAIGRGLRAARAAKLDGRTDGPEDELTQALGGARER